MHFFNPVYRMPLVEVIRGPKSSEAAIATVVAFAQQMGKTPVVVNDCPGFLVNRVLGPYMAAFQLLVADGAAFETIDKTMEGFGWPMGPAYLNDVVGLDTAYHAGQVMAQAFPDRFQRAKPLPGELLFKAGYLGQKNSKGFYRYDADKKGGQKKVFDPAVYAVKMLEDYPLFGTGAGTFYTAFTRYRGHDIPDFYDHVHNDYIQFLAETGLVGLALALGLPAFALALAVLALARRRDPLARGFAFAVLMGLCSIGIHSAVDFNLQIPANALAFMVLLAYGWVAMYLDRSDVF